MTDSKKQFVNRKEVPIEAAGMVGKLTIPIYLEDGHLETYYDRVAEVEKSRGKDEAEVGSAEFFGNLKSQIGWQLFVVAHIPIDIDFPGVDIHEIKDTTTKFRALGLAIYKECKKLVDEATIVPL